jgi:hypothetical protein
LCLVRGCRSDCGWQYGRMYTHGRMENTALRLMGEGPSHYPLQCARIQRHWKSEKNAKAKRKAVLIAAAKQKSHCRAAHRSSNEGTGKKGSRRGDRRKRDGGSWGKAAGARG